MAVAEEVVVLGTELEEPEVIDKVDEIELEEADSEERELLDRLLEGATVEVGGEELGDAVGPEEPVTLADSSVIADVLDNDATVAELGAADVGRKVAAVTIAVGPC